MNLKRIGCQYFLHFGEWNEISFEEDQRIISIVGEWSKEPKRSNRSGKSSFVEIILYVLYGKTRAKKEISLINKNYPEEDMICELEFDDGITIKRGRSSNNDIILDMTGYEGADKKVIQEEIDKYIGLCYEDFIMTSYFLQGDIHTFMDAGPTGQKQIISKWLEKGYWKDFEQEAKKRMDDIQKEMDKLQLVIDNKPDPVRDDEIRNGINILNTQKTTLDTQLETLNKALEVINNQIKKANDLAEVEKSVKSLKTEVKNIDDEITEFNEEVDDWKKKIPKAEQNEKRLKEIENINTSNEEAAKTKLDDAKKIAKEKIQEHATLKAEFKNLKSQFEKLNEFDSICPISGEQCDSAGSMESTKTELRRNGITKSAEIKKLETKIEGFNKDVDAAQKELDKIKEQLNEIKLLKKELTKKDIQEKVDYLNTKIKTKNELLKQKKESLEQKEKNLKELETIDVDKYKREKNETNAKITDNKKSLSDIINDIAAQQAELKQLKEKRQLAIKAEKDIEELNKKHNLHKFVSYMFGKNGIPSNQIESAFGEIEEEGNIILEKVSSDISLEFTPDRELDAWEPNCLVCGMPFPKGYRKTECPECGNERQKKKKDELNIIITTGGNEIDFNLESGGGKVLISLAIRLAFVRLLQRRIGVNLKLIVFDEIFGMLDEVNRQYVFKLLAKTLIEDFDFNQILCISHEAEIRDVLPNVIKVTKYDKYSTFGWD